MVTGQEQERVVIVGSGPAGAAAALKLAELRLPVTMLESGESVPRDFLLRARGRTVFRHRSKRVVRRTAIVAPPGTGWLTALEPGGLSNQWTGAVPRFNSEDFVDGCRLHDRYRWPLSYDNLAPYYDRIEQVLKVAGAVGKVPGLSAQQVAYPCKLPNDWQRVAEIAAQFGHGLCPTPMAGGAPWAVIPSATTFSSWTIIRRLLRSPDFELRLGAHALQLQWDSKRRRASGVVYHDRTTNSTRQVSAGAIVVAGGPLSSTKLLFDSACSDFPAGLGNTEDLLGRYLHDHYHDMFVLRLDRPLRRLGQPAYVTRAPYASTPPLVGVQATIGGRFSQLERLLSFTPLRSDTFGVITFGSTTPVETNTARPDRTEKDEFSLPALHLEFNFTEDERKQSLGARDRVREILLAAGINSDITWSLPKPIAGSSVHYGGTVRMHQNPAYGITDTYCRLHAVKNVAIVDASCFTTAVEKNPSLTVMAIATRASEQIGRDLRNGA